MNLTLWIGSHQLPHFIEVTDEQGKCVPMPAYGIAGDALKEAGDAVGAQVHCNDDDLYLDIDNGDPEGIGYEGTDDDAVREAVGIIVVALAQAGFPVRVIVRTPCAACGGEGRLIHQGDDCVACGGTGNTPQATT